MWVTVAGFDYTANIPINGSGKNAQTEEFKQTSNDPASSFNFDVQDDGSLFNFQIDDEVISWDETSVLSPPSNNLVTQFNNSGWFTDGPIASHISPFPAPVPIMTFSNITYTGSNNAGFITATCPQGHIHAGQTYMFSVYATIATPLVNALAIVKMQFLNSVGATIGPVTSISFSTTTSATGNPNAQQRISISATAPANAAYVQVWCGGQATVSGTNSGTISYTIPQVEPLFFTGAKFSSRYYPVSYPTPDCNFHHADCANLPDDTTSRMVRFFSGTINNIKKEYIGNNRVWHLQCAGPGALMEDGLINGTYSDPVTNTLDSFIIGSVINNAVLYRNISTSPANSFSPQPLTPGVTLSSITYSDNTLKDVLNGMTSQSNYIYYLDPYYTLYYQPQVSSTASFTLSDSPDNVNSFPYYDYDIEEDGTQLKRNVKVKGGNFNGWRQDIFSGNGITTQFSLTYIPSAMNGVFVGSAVLRVGVYGRDDFTGPYDVLLNTQLQFLLFKVAPASGVGNAFCEYFYNAPISCYVSSDTSNSIAPFYTQSRYDVVVNDATIADLDTGTQRGIAEIVEFGNPLVIINCKSQKYAPAGSCIPFTSAADDITSQLFVVQSVIGRMVGTDENMEAYNKFTYQLGGYQPNFVDHIKNLNKALNRSNTVANVTAAQQFDAVAIEIIGYFDSITANVQPVYSTNVYGTGIYGSMAYGSTTGTYNGTAKYGLSTSYA